MFFKINVGGTQFRGDTDIFWGLKYVNLDPGLNKLQYYIIDGVEWGKIVEIMINLNLLIR